MRGAAVLTRTSSLWLIGLALFVVVKTGVLTPLLIETFSPGDSIHDTYYVVADIRYLIAFGSLFAIFAAFYLWCERSWGRRYDDRLGKAHFAVAMAGIALIVIPQIALSIQGMPARYVDYDENSFRNWTMVGAAGPVVFALSVIPFALVCLRAYFTPPPEAA